MGKVRYGLSNVHYAIYDETNNEYGDWKAIPGAVSLTIDKEDNKNDFYADNIVYAVVKNTSKETGSIEFAALTKDIEHDLFGVTSDSVSGLEYATTDAAPVSIALGYEIDGNVKKQRGLRYNVTLDEPNFAANTETDSTNPDTVTANITALAREFEITTGSGQDAVTEKIYVLKAHTDDDATASSTGEDAYNKFWNAVIVPGQAPTSA